MINFLKRLFSKDFWITEFPDCYSPECFDCNLSNDDCKDCEFNETV